MKLIKQSMRKFWGVVLLMIMGNLFAINADAADSREYFMNALSQVGLEGNVYTVDQNGQGDFNSIMEGVEAIEPNDTLIINPGIYCENVDTHDKTINLIGIDKDKCIIKADSTRYFYIPLSIATGRVYNLTIYGTNTSGKTINETPAEYPNLYDPQEVYEWRASHPGYAVHIDWDEEYGGRMEFANCSFITENSACVGIGTRGDYSLIFESCDFVSKSGTNCLFLHNLQNPFCQGQAYVELKNCSLINEKRSEIMLIHSMGNINPIKISLQNNRVEKQTGKTSFEIYNDEACEEENGWNGLAYIYLNEDSYGNSEDFMNYENYNVFASE